MQAKYKLLVYVYEIYVHLVSSFLPVSLHWPVIKFIMVLDRVWSESQSALSPRPETKLIGRRSGDCATLQTAEKFVGLFVWNVGFLRLYKF